MAKKKVRFEELRRTAGEISLAELDTVGDRSVDRDDAKGWKQKDIERIEELLYLMFAENRRSLLIVLQGIDASGKNGLTKHLAKGIRPDGMQVHSCGPPSTLELDHDYLWRAHLHTPQRGNVSIFNRSHYEEVIVTRVHPEILREQRLPPEILNDPDIFERRYRQINDFERMLHENGTVIIKLLLHISKEEQIERLRSRLEKRSTHWKFDDHDLQKRKHWNDYMKAFEKMIAATSTDWAPWYVVPADRKWYRNLVVGDLVVRTLAGLHMEFPEHHAAEVTLEQMEKA